MGHVSKKVKNQPWYSILWYDSTTFRKMKSNLDLLMKIGDGNTEFCKKQMLGCVLTESLTIHQDVLKAFANVQHCTINKSSLVVSESVYDGLPQDYVSELVNKKVAIQPSVGGMVLLIFPKATIKEQFQARCGQASC